VTPNGFLQIAVFFLVVLALTRPVGAFMARVFEGERTWFHPALRPLERLIYRLCGIHEDQEQRWTGYAASLLTFSLVSLLLTYLIQRIQGFLPFNPQGFGTAHAAQGSTAMTPDLAFNTAVSFTTNTNWQAYTPETTMSYLTQMVGLATHNFFSAAAGIAIAIALVRGFARHSSDKIGNFWVDLVRATVCCCLCPF
jgi:K+-transporting ATPase ATPase A chain